MTIKEPEPTYSSIIGSREFIELMTFQHLYIAEADAVVEKLIKDTEETREGKKLEVVELGCGPVRLLQRLADRRTHPHIRLTGVDHDPTFIRDGSEILRERRVHADLIVADLITYAHPRPVDVFYSQGVHHHIRKGNPTERYLKNVYRQLKPGGLFILSDEFLPEYRTPHERKLRSILWHAHIISNAISNNYRHLAEEEAKTLLDDLHATNFQINFKSREQIQAVLNCAPHLHSLVEARKFLNLLLNIRSFAKTGVASLDLSRGDFKISDSAFRNEIKRTGFKIESHQKIGPAESVGGFRIYVLQK